MDQDLQLLGTPVAASQAVFETASSKLIWQQTNLSNGLTTVLAQSAASGSVAQTIATVPKEWKAIAASDFNGDGQTDILWRHEISGSLGWWLLDDQGQFQQIAWTGIVADSTWRIVGTGDVNADGQIDLLWRNTVSQSLGWWVMKPYKANSQSYQIFNSNDVLQSVLWVAELTDPNWQVVGVGDFDGDRDADLLWWYTPSGSLTWSQKQLGQHQQYVWLNDQTAPRQRPVGINDFNGDGTLDLVVQDETNGTSYLWMMQKPVGNATITTTKSTVLAQPAGAGWQVVGAGKMLEPDAGNSLNRATWQASSVFTRSQTIGGANDLNDFYQFNIGSSGVFTATLSGLQADADVRLRSSTGEVLAWQWERNNASESIRRFLNAGTYFLEVTSYNGQLTNYQVQTGFTVSAEDPLKFDLRLDFGTGSERLDATTRSALQAAESFWESVILSRTNVTLNPVLPINIVIEDLNLKTGEADFLTLAYAGPTVVSDGKRLLIQSATATINGRRLGTLGFDSLKDLFIHEFSHALGFGTLWEPLSFRNADGSIRKIGYLGDDRSLVDRSTNRYQANSYAGWAYGELLRDSGRANVTQPTAVPIEAQFFAHWDESIFQTESLTPVANQAGVASPISQLTLASLRDLGWSVNMGAAQSYTLPTSPTASADIDFNSFVRPNSGAASVHPTNCGCQYHLASNVDTVYETIAPVSSGSGLALIGATTLAETIGLD